MAGESPSAYFSAVLAHWVYKKESNFDQLSSVVQFSWCSVDGEI